MKRRSRLASILKNSGSLAAIVVGSGVAASTFAPEATAADLGTYKPAAPAVMAPVTNWTGLYVGGHLGATWADVDNTLSFLGFSERFSHDPDGFSGGAHIGWLQQWSGVVAGVETSWTGMDISDTQPSVLFNNRFRTVDVDDLITITGRVGATIGSQSLIYVLGGYASAEVETFAINRNTGVTSNTDGREDGWVLGIGIETTMFRPNLRFGLEYNYVDLDVDARSAIATDGTPITRSNFDVDLQTVMFRASYAFGSQRSYTPMK